MEMMPSLPGGQMLAVLEDGGFISLTFSLGLELPRINYAHNGRPYRYVFAAEVQWSPIPTKVPSPCVVSTGFLSCK